ncbi:MAG TPA: 2-dehydropantoate 2-reductase [Bauldia sp.]|nr:2-dehydropantoate 2-reductase [Bauldia sp.]
MRIAVLGGGGAMGGLFGGSLALVGEEVVLIDVSKAAIDAITASGLKIEEKDGTVRIAHVKASSTPAEVGPVDLILNFVKCYHTADAIRAALPMFGPQTAVLSLQNGWGNADTIGAVVGSARVMVGLTYHSATLVAPGHIRHPGLGPTYIGELGGATTARLEDAGNALQRAGFEVRLSPAILDEVWKKLALNVCTLPTGALLGFFANQLGQHAGTRSLMQALLGEVVAVAAVQGIKLDAGERWSAITGVLEKAVGAKASMLQDREARRRTEIDVINGAIVEAGRRHGVATPMNESMVWLVKSMEEAYLGEAKA